MKKLFLHSLTLFLGLSLSAQAAFISGNQSLSDGRLVDLQGLEWMPLSYTAGISRNDVEDGFTDTFGGVWAKGEWRYATRKETETLLGSLWGGRFDGWSGDNFTGAEWFNMTLGGLGFDSGFGNSRVNNRHYDYGFNGMDYAGFFFGDDLECSPDQAFTCGGLVYSSFGYDRDAYSVDVVSQQLALSYKKNSYGFGHFSEREGVSMGLSDTNISYTKDTSNYAFGNLLVRDVSAPSAFLILLFGFLTISMQRGSNSRKV